MTEKVFLQTFVYVWIYVVVGVIAFWIVGDFDYGLAFFVSSLASVMLMSHNYKTTMKTADKNPEKLPVRTMQNYVFRYIFYIIITLALYFREENIYHLIPIFLGFAAFKVVMMATFYIHRKGVNKDD